MDLRPKIQLDSMIKAMTEVVLPAVDPNNQLAREQAQLVLGMLHLMAARLPWQFHFDIDALDRAVNLSSFILENSDGGSATQHALKDLKQASEGASGVLARASVSPDKLEETLLELRAKTSSVVDALWTDGEIDCRDSIARAVLDAAREQTTRERAWFAPQGWDNPAEAPLPLEGLLKTTPDD